MMEAIKIDPTARYVIFVRDADPEWAALIEQSIREWWNSPSPVKIINVPGQGQVFLEKIGIKRRDNASKLGHQSGS